ncbi:MAG: hypothetical protein Q7T14_09030, partial [Aestuariivirga sp.]|nr:hypothetical protein [Aestuariivirga sp.]
SSAPRRPLRSGMTSSGALSPAGARLWSASRLQAGKTASISALSRRLAAVTIRQFPANMGLPLQDMGQTGKR